MVRVTVRDSCRALVLVMVMVMTMMSKIVLHIMVDMVQCTGYGDDDGYGYVGESEHGCVCDGTDDDTMVLW